MQSQHPLPALLIEYRRLAKLLKWVRAHGFTRSSYMDGLSKELLVSPYLAAGTQRIYTTWNQTATGTGRLSTSAPNLQSLPKVAERRRSERVEERGASGRPGRARADGDQER